MEINKRDKTHHESEVCDFRRVKCHDCAELRKEMTVHLQMMKEIKDLIIRMKEEMKAGVKFVIKAFIVRTQEKILLLLRDMATSQSLWKCSAWRRKLRITVAAEFISFILQE